MNSIELHRFAPNFSIMINVIKTKLKLLSQHLFIYIVILLRTPFLEIDWVT